MRPSFGYFAALFAVALGTSSCGGAPFREASDDASTLDDAMPGSDSAALDDVDHRLGDARGDRPERLDSSNGGDATTDMDAAPDDAIAADGPIADGAVDASGRDGATGDASGQDGASDASDMDASGLDGASDGAANDGAAAMDGGDAAPEDGGMMVDASPICLRPCGIACCKLGMTCCPGTSFCRSTSSGGLCPLPPVMTTAQPVTN